MTKPLNKEWEYFGPRYRVSNAKVDKVDCNACKKPVSAAVNRLQSHLRICVARTHNQICSTTGPSPIDVHQTQPALVAVSERNEHEDSPSDDSINSYTSARASAQNLDHEIPHALHIDREGPKRQRICYCLSEHSMTNDGNFETVVNSSLISNVYTKKRLELDEKRLQLELKKDLREEKKELFQLEILKAQARKEWLEVGKKDIERKKLLALARKDLFDKGVTVDEVDRLLPLDDQSSESILSFTKELQPIGDTE